MTHIRTLGLALVAALALAGLGGAPGASGATLCSVAASPCPAASVVPPSFLVGGQLAGAATFTMGPGTISCATSAFGARVLTNAANPIDALVGTWTFGGCVLQPLNVPCTVVALPSPPPLSWPVRITTPGTILAGSQGDVAVDNFDVRVTCQGFAACSVSGPGGPRTIAGGWFDPTVASPPKPVASPHAEIAFSAAVTGGPTAPCGAGTFRAAYEVTQAPFPGADLWLV